MNWPEDYINQIVCGDSLTVLKQMPDESVQCAITSPPYWGLRDYGLEPIVWGGKKGGENLGYGPRVIASPLVTEKDCEHVWGGKSIIKKRGVIGGSDIVPSQRRDLDSQYKSQGQFCRLCGSWRGNLGLEPDIGLYVSHLVEIFREVKRILRSNGCLFLNLGDSYWGGKGQSSQAWSTEHQNRKTLQKNQHQICGKGETRPSDGKSDIYKPKDLCGIPWRVAFALQADGWWLRSDIIWAKPNPMPESVTDRPTKSHEYIFLLTKSKSYFYDQDAVREKQLMTRKPGKCHLPARGLNEFGVKDWKGEERYYHPGGRNRRTVWTIATQPFPEAHFATFPLDLVRPMILAGTSERGCCSECGAPYERIVEEKAMVIKRSNRGEMLGQYGKTAASGTMVSPAESKTIGWRPTCSCGVDADIEPCIVLDPFMGSGTVALVATKLGRNYIGIELKQEYIEIARKRVAQVEEQSDLFKKPEEVKQSKLL